MKQRLLMLVVLVTVVGVVIAQTPDTLLIEPGDLGALESTINGDTTATGERVNPNRVYQLVRGAIYFMNGPIQTTGWPLTVVGQEEDPANSTTPPIIARGIREDGSSPGQFIQSQGNVTLKNLYIQYVTPNGNLPWNPMQLRSDSVRLVVDNCVMENAFGIAFRTFGVGAKIFITNSYYRNCITADQEWGGRGIHLGNNPADTLVMVNNTYFNSSSFFMLSRNNLINYARLEHNSIINTVKWPFQWSWPTHAIISNNLFYNCHSYGEAPSDLPGQDFDGQIFGIVNIDTLSADMQAAYGQSEANRKVELKNNCWFYSDAVVNYQTALDSVDGLIFLNDRTQAMFDDDAGYPLFVEENTMNLDPGFGEAVDQSADSLVAWMQNLREGGAGFNWNYDPDGNDFGVLTWPLPEDLSYPTDSPLYAAATDGFPVGDLNWFPEKKAEWSMDTDVEEYADVKAPGNFTLKQNYPNPFNPTTSIQYTIQKNAKVELRVYNTMGREVETLVKEKQSAGKYRVNFAGNDLASGIYIASLMIDGKQVSSIRMLLLK